NTHPHTPHHKNHPFDGVLPSLTLPQPLTHTPTRHNKPKGRFFWFVVVSVYRIILYSHLLPSHKLTNNFTRKAQRPKEPSLWLPLVGGGWIFEDFLGDS
ncbi:MAG: hypothetical protein PUI23_01175, partial [Bacteroidales bacterium]|nr:hypothetical protein [Bacteroidales bacterium]MDY5226193.1 hypothetical protein [Sodaliphilus sp.]